MSTPFSSLALALTGAGGRIDYYEAQQLVAAGFTLLRRCAPLVRAVHGKRSAILLPTSPQMLVALAASEGRGAVLVNPLAAEPEIAYQMDDAGVGAVFTNAALVGRVPESIPRVLLDDAPRSARVLVDGSSREVDLGSHVGMPLEGETDVAGRDEEAAIVYTSAMAGTPLGAILTHRNLLSNARATVVAGGLDRDERSLALLPLAHLFGLTVTFDAPLLAGGTVLTMERFNPVAALEQIRSERITLLVGVPAVFHAMVAALDRRPVDRAEFETLRVCLCGGAALSIELQDRWADATGVELRQGYGLTEAAPVCLFNRCDRANVRGMLGAPLPEVDVEIRAPVLWRADGRPDMRMSTPNAALPDGEIGEICVRGPGVFKGYVGDSDAGLFVRDGWLHTGDLGCRRPDGTIGFSGLLKPMFTRNGFNVYPREIERALCELPGVRAATVIPRPVPARENDIVATVHGRADESEVRAWCEHRLAAYKQPAEIIVLDE